MSSDSDDYFVSGECGDDLTWSIDAEGTLTIFGTGAMWDYEFDYEEQHTTAPWANYSPVKLVLNEGITHIGSAAFEEIDFTGSLILPEGLASIGGSAFSGCREFTGDLTLPESLTSIGWNAFWACHGLTSVTIPKSVEEIYSGAFSYCSSLSNIIVNGNASYDAVDSVLFNKSHTVLLAYPAGKEDSAYEIPEGVVAIASSAFEGNSNLTSVTIPRSVTKIEWGVFSGCNSLKDVYYAGNQTWWDRIKIQNGNDSLLNATIHVSSDSEDFSASGECGNNLTWNIDAEGTLTISGTGAMWDYERIEWHTSAPWYAYSPVKLVLNEGITHIGSTAFEEMDFTGSLTLPKSLTSIGNAAFENCDGFTGNLILPENLTSIDTAAFFYCKGFTGSLTLPTKLTSIGWGAFMGCSGLTSVTIPRSVKNIGRAVFSDCSSLSNIIVSGNTSYDSVDNILFNKDHTILLAYPAGKEDTSYVIPEGVTEVCDYAFDGCSNLTSVTIPESVTYIGNGAFDSCTNMASVTIPNSVTSIEYGVFRGCSNLTSVTIPWRVTEIGQDAFSDCNSLKDVYYAGSQVRWNRIQILDGNGPLYNATFHFDPNVPVGSGSCGENLTWSVDADGTLTISGTGAMQDYESAANEWHTAAPWYNYFPTGLVLKEGITYIGQYAFVGCDFVGSLTLPEGVVSIGDNAFCGCSNLTSVSIPQSVTTIGNWAFQGCYGLTSAVIPEGVTSIGDWAFQACFGLSSLTIPKSVTSIGEAAFAGCFSNFVVDEGNAAYASADGILYNKDRTMLIAYPAYKGDTAYEIPEGVTGIGGYAFFNCRYLTDVTIPEGIKSIGDYAFEASYNLTNVTIPQSVTSIGEGAFLDCPALSDVYYTGSLTQWNSIKIGKENEPLLNATLHLRPASYIASGTCGENLTWTLTGDGTLTISGSGKMEDYSYNSTPWYADREKIRSVFVEPGVTSVGRYAFMQCTNLTSVEIPEGVTSIGDSAFALCRNLASVVIPEGVTSLEWNAFSACYSLTSVTVPASVTYISCMAFGACLTLENIFVEEGNASYDSVDGILFSKDHTTLIIYPTGRKDASYTILEGVTKVGDYAINNCWYLTSVTIPKSVSSIGNEAFGSCRNLNGIFVDGENASYDSVDGILFNKDHTTLIAYPEGKSDTVYTIPDGVTSIANSAFRFCSLTGVVIPEGVTRIGWAAFDGCYNLKDVYYVGSQAQWEKIQIADYNAPILNAAIHFNSVGPCSELTLDREYITLSVDAEPVQLQAFPEYARKAIVWSVESPADTQVIEVSDDGCVTPLNPGTAYVVASLNTGDDILTARCRVDVTKKAANEEVLGVDLGTKKVTTELYSTDYAKIDILLLLEQNEVALFAAPQNSGTVITDAYLEDETARQFFDLVVKDDRQLLLVPTQEALDNAKNVKSSYSSKIVVSVNGVEYHTEDAVAITVKKTTPKLKVSSLTFNPFYTEESQSLTITGGTVTKVECTTPDWLTMDGTKLTLNNAPKSGSASLNLVVYTAEWAIPASVKVSVRLSYKAPSLRLSASSVILSETNSLGVTLKLTAGKQSLEELNVKSVTLPAGFEDAKLDLYTGEIALVPTGEIPTGKQTVQVSFYGTDSVLDLPLTVNKRTPTLRLSKSSVSLNAELGDSVTLKVTATPADLDLTKVTVTNPSEALEVSPVNENGEFTVTVKQGSACKASYALTVQAPTGKAVKLTVKTLAAGQKATMSLKAVGSIDLTFPEKGVTLQPTFRNYSGELENVVYTLALKQGKVTADADFADYLTIGEDGLIRWNETGTLESGTVCLVTMTGELPDGTVLSGTAQVKVTQSSVVLKLGKTSLSLNKRLEEKTWVTVTTSTKGYTLGDVELRVTDNKNVPSDGLTAVYANGMLFLSVNEKTTYGGSYKVQLWVTPKNIATLTVKIPAEKSSAVTMTTRVKGNIDVIRDAAEVLVTPTYKNCLDGSSLEKQVKVTWAQDGKNYNEDVTKDFILTWAQDGTLHVSKIPGKELALTGKYRLEIQCEGMEKEAYAALSVKCGTARFTAASVSLYAKDANDMARLAITTTDTTVNTLERVELKDAKLKGTYEVLNLGNGQFALRLLPGAQAKSGTVTLNIFCEGNTTAKPSGTVSVKVEIR